MERFNYKALLLDLDGTLINSEKAFFSCFRDVLKDHYGVLITSEEYKKYELEQNALLIEMKRREYNSLRNVTDSEVMQHVYGSYEEYFKRIIREKIAKSNFELLKMLNEKGIRLSLVTTCRKRYIDLLLELYDLYSTFEYIVAREDVPKEELKPHPRAYLMALNQMGLKPHEALSLEDSKRGVDAAVAAGIPVIKVDSFTAIKYHDDRCVEEESANEVLQRILKSK